ncbi:MAG: efflux RND transporter permease subunit [Planctomycetaceae bacterium]|jgi:hydrophobe/amphiphile efflux-1 (HAE1) family protein|nr:efflux RND transporter permease subunit [Planctomycetaceae bacterium]
MFSHFFIDRPIFSCVVCLVITLLGIVSIPNLAIEQFPDITPPTIAVNATFPGASAEDVANTVAIPLEQQLNGVDDMIYMETQCTSDGTMSITISFAVGTNPDIASVLVQNRVKAAEPLLPDEVRRLGVRVDKRATNFVCFMSLFEKVKKQPEKNIASKTGIANALAKLKSGTADATSNNLSENKNAENEGQEIISEGSLLAQSGGTKSGPYLANYASLYIKDRLARVKDVGEVRTFDNRDFSMRVWLDENVMAARKVSVIDIQSAIAAQNVQVAAGRIGVSPIPEGVQTSLAIVTLGRLKDVTEFENIIIRQDENGGLLRLKDVARIELGAANYTMESRYNGKMSTGMAIAPRSGANAIEVAKNVIKELDSMKDSLARSGLECEITFNATDFISATVDEFKETLILCVFFVVLTVYMFLQDWRAALIPTLTIPVSIVGTFFLMNLFQFSINTMTLFGMILVIGIVVDDAIVVVENTQRIIDEEHLDGVAAAKKSMIQVIGPVVATVLVMMAVFVPTAMMQGIVGKLYKQFALTIAGAIGISGICGVTLAPALCAILLRPSVPKEKRLPHFRLFNFFFDGFRGIYLATVRFFIRIAPLMLILWFLLVYLLITIMGKMPSGFLPNEDQGVIFLETKLPEGASQERTRKALTLVEKMIDRQKEIKRDDKGKIISGGIKGAMLINGFSFFSGAGSNHGMAILRLEQWKDRKDRGLKPSAIIDRLKKDLEFSVPEAEFMLTTPPPIMGLGMSTGVSFVLLDERDVGANTLVTVAEDIREQMRKMQASNNDPLFVHTMLPFNPRSPRLYLDIDRDKVMRLGVNLTEVFAALASTLGTAYINDFNVFGRTYRVNVQAEGKYRDNINDVYTIKVRNKYGTMVPLSSFVTLREISGPQLLTRYNLFPSAALTGIVHPLHSTSEGITAMEKLQLPDGFSSAWTGVTFQEKQAGGQAVIFFAVSIMFAFLILAAQYESWSSPLIIMMAVPLGIAGSVTAVFLFGLFGGSLLEINLYTQIGLLMMIGLSAKNAIFITEFAKHRRVHENMSLVQSAYEAGRLRIRPIFMTSFAFILGVTPLVLANGAGAVSRNAIGNCVFGGLLMETMVGVYVTPVLFVLIQGLAEHCNKYIRAALAQKPKVLTNNNNCSARTTI